MEEDVTTLSFGKWEVRGWKADVIVFSAAAVILGIAFLAGYLVGATT